MTVQPPGNFDFDAAANAAVAQAVSLINDTGTITAPGNYTSATVPINTVGFELTLELAYSGAATTPLALVNLLWSDTASSLPIWSETYWLAVPGTSFAFPKLIGKAKGNQLQVVINNLDTTSALAYTTLVNGISRDYEESPVLYSLATAPAGFTNVNSDPTIGLLASVSPSTPVATPSARLMPTYWGLVEFSVAPPAGATCVVSLQPQAAYTGFAIQPIAPIVCSAAGVAVSAVRALPNCPVLLTITNTGAATASFPVTAIIQRIRS